MSVPAITRRALACSLVGAVASPQTAAAPAADPDPILAAIEAHRLAAERDQQAVRSFARLAGADLALAHKDRKRLRKLRHARRRDLRRATPTTGEGFRALRRYYDSLVPVDHDPDGIGERCRRDFAEAVARFEGRAQP